MKRTALSFSLFYDIHKLREFLMKPLHKNLSQNMIQLSYKTWERSWVN